MSSSPPPHLIRALPDSSAPNAPSHLIYSLITSLTYVLYLSILPIYIPCLILIHFSTSRPFPTWSLDQRISTRLNKLRTNLFAYWIPPNPYDDWSIAPPGEAYREASERGEVELEVVDLEPVGEEWKKGIAKVEGVKGVTRPGFWTRPKGWDDKKVKGEDKVILHIHGGSYIRGHPLWTTFAMDIAKLTGLRCLTVNYRKTLSATTAFPAPLLDVLSAYTYLTRTLSIPSSGIILLGESAGAHLALCLSQYVHFLGLPQPGYMALSSPWCDFTLSFPSYRTNADFDQLTPLRLRKAVRSATRWYKPSAVESWWFSPARVKEPTEHWEYLKDEGVKVYMQYGGRELMRDEIVTLGRGMKTAGVDVSVREHVDGLHTGGLSDPIAKKAFQKDLLEMLRR
ncbi:hypothetical protein CI109_103956 [Kwoniella shandongensis]|uniref:Uncharacterized protein n=1 Tax=Kwoniella shandongensis TaxID=1734106 RepID=A0A5M6BT18_9TREE|nr:uncharacterized protein CI109_005589 [Kwoniella shandongensis]KAA5525994.1 hypothetical protein CI109_005589 [Kwoniella shandongensis]